MPHASPLPDITVIDVENLPVGSLACSTPDEAMAKESSVDMLNDSISLNYEEGKRFAEMLLN